MYVELCSDFHFHPLTVQFCVKIKVSASGSVPPGVCAMFSEFGPYCVCYIFLLARTQIYLLSLCVSVDHNSHAYFF